MHDLHLAQPRGTDGVRVIREQRDEGLPVRVRVRARVRVRVSVRIRVRVRVGLGVVGTRCARPLGRDDRVHHHLSGVARAWVVRRKC